MPTEMGRPIHRNVDFVTKMLVPDASFIAGQLKAFISQIATLDQQLWISCIEACLASYCNCYHGIPLHSGAS